MEKQTMIGTTRSYRAPARSRRVARSWRAANVQGAIGALGALAVAVCGAFGCTLAVDDWDENAGSSKSDRDGSCPSEDCGKNSAYVNGYPVDELHLPLRSAREPRTIKSGGVSQLMPPGLPNVAGVQVTGFILDNGRAAFLFAEHGELMAMLDNGVVLKGANLIGGQILIVRNTSDAAIPDAIIIQDYQHVDNKVHNYRFTYEPEEPPPGRDDPVLSVCRTAAETGQSDLTWAVILTEERYVHSSAPSYDVMPDIVPPTTRGWFNIACQGTAMNKARWWGYYPDSNSATEYSSWQQRQAVLKSIVNDACGINEMFTESGTQVAWHNGQDFLSKPSEWNLSDMAVESIWNENGAVCISQPRRPSGKMDVEEEVTAHCPELLQQPCPSLDVALSELTQRGTIVTLVEDIP